MRQKIKNIELDPVILFEISYIHPRWLGIKELEMLRIWGVLRLWIRRRLLLLRLALAYLSIGPKWRVRCWYRTNSSRSLLEIAIATRDQACKVPGIPLLETRQKIIDMDLDLLMSYKVWYIHLAHPSCRFNAYQCSFQPGICTNAHFLPFLPPPPLLTAGKPNSGSVSKLSRLNSPLRIEIGKSSFS